jgi:hypothetical protein
MVSDRTRSTPRARPENRNHRLNSIHQVQNDLPQLDPISQDAREVVSKLNSTGHSTIFKITLHKGHHLAD